MSHATGDINSAEAPTAGMIHILIGTRAQLIKMAPVMYELRERGLDYNFIFMAQHRETIREILADFGLKQPDYVLGDVGTDIVSAPRMAFWSLSVLGSGFARRAQIFRGDKDGIVLVHGDAPPLLLGALLARAQGLRVAAIEAGLRSFSLWRPFPEELTRVATAKLGLIDLHFCQDDKSLDNARRYPGTAIDAGGNTIVDAVSLARDLRATHPPSGSPYAVISLHRFESISKRSGVQRIAELAQRIAQSLSVKFILHPPTRAALIKFGYYDRLAATANLELLPRQRFIDFQGLLAGAAFMVTDGGSNQEECAYLGIPTLIFRRETERGDGLGHNAVLSEFSAASIEHFIGHYQQYRQQPQTEPGSPSARIVDEIARRCVGGNQ